MLPLFDLDILGPQKYGPPLYKRENIAIDGRVEIPDITFDELTGMKWGVRRSAIDLSEARISVKMLENGRFRDVPDGSFNGYGFELKGLGQRRLFDARLNKDSNSLGLDSSAISTSGNTVYVNFDNLPYVYGQGFAIDLSFSSAGRRRGRPRTQIDEPQATPSQDLTRKPTGIPNTITVDVLAPTKTSGSLFYHDVTVGDSVEIQNFSVDRITGQRWPIKPVLMDFSPGRIRVEMLDSGGFFDVENTSFNGYGILYHGLGASVIAGVDISGTFNTFGLKNNALSYSSNTVYVNLDGVSYEKGQGFELIVAFSA